MTLINLVENEEQFVINGSAEVTIDKRFGYLMMGDKDSYPKPLYGFVEKEHIRGFSLDKELNLHLSYGRKKEIIVKVGKVKNLNEAKAWVSAVNKLYSGNSF